MNETIKIVANENMDTNGHFWSKGETYAYYINPSGRMTLTSNQGQLGYPESQIEAVLSLFTVVEDNSSNLILVSSNEGKLKEFKEFGLTDISIEKGKDLPEVEADAATVALYKALAAGKSHIVEDTSLVIEGADVGVNVRWLMSNIKEHVGHSAKWQVYLALNKGDVIELYFGEIHGKIVAQEGELKGFGFDSLFSPNSASGQTLYQLEQIGKKSAYSARAHAISNLLKSAPVEIVAISDLPEWTGKYQNES